MVISPMPRTSPTPSAERRMRVMSRVGRQATRPSLTSNPPAGQAAKASPMPAPVVGSPASVSRSLGPLLPPPPPPPPITVAAGITVTPSRSTGSPKTWRALSASRSDLNASCGSTGSVVRARWSRSCVATAPTGSSNGARPLSPPPARRARRDQRRQRRAIEVRPRFAEPVSYPGCTVECLRGDLSRRPVPLQLHDHKIALGTNAHGINAQDVESRRSRSGPLGNHQ